MNSAESRWILAGLSQDRALRALNPAGIEAVQAAWSAEYITDDTSVSGSTGRFGFAKVGTMRLPPDNDRESPKAKALAVAAVAVIVISVIGFGHTHPIVTVFGVATGVAVGLIAANIDTG